MRIVQRDNQRFYDVCREAYAAQQSMDGAGPAEGVETYQRERIQIDVIYHHPDNQQLIDEYKRILASCAGSAISSSARARLMRLRTLSLRNEVPLSIFDTLEEIVLQEHHVSAGDEEESDYIASTREILGGFLLGKNISRRLSSTFCRSRRYRSFASSPTCTGTVDEYVWLNQKRSTPRYTVSGR